MKQNGVAKAANDYMYIYEKFVAGPSRGRKGGTYGHKRLMLQLKKDVKLSRKFISSLRYVNTSCQDLLLKLQRDILPCNGTFCQPV